MTMLLAAVPAQGAPKRPPQPPLSCGQTVSGNVKLTHDLICSDVPADGEVVIHGLVVGADNTVIDLNGHKIVCRTAVTGYQGSCQGDSAAGNLRDPQQEVGIKIEGRRNVRVFSNKKAGRATIDGFDYGVQAASSSGVTIERLIVTGPPRLEGDLSARPPSNGIAIYGKSCSDSAGCAEDPSRLGTGACTEPNRVGTGPDSGNDVSNHNQGIIMIGSCTEVAYNRVHDTNCGGCSFPTNGIIFHGADNNSVHDNTVVQTGDGVDTQVIDGAITLRNLADHNLIANNIVNDNLGDGISTRSGSSANRIDGNTMLRNGGTLAGSIFFDAAGRPNEPTNEWTPANICVLQNSEVPAGVCGPTEGN